MRGLYVWIAGLLAIAGMLLIHSPSRGQAPKNRSGVSEFAREQLRQDGFETVARCNGTKLTIELVSVPPEGDGDRVIRLLASLTHLGHLLKREHGLEDDFALEIVLWSEGSITTTAGRLEAFAEKLLGKRATREDFEDAFDFRRNRQGERPAGEGIRDKSCPEGLRCPSEGTTGIAAPVPCRFSAKGHDEGTATGIASGNGRAGGPAAWRKTIWSL